MHLADRALALLDHPLLTRVGNLRTLVSVIGVLGLLVVAVLLARFELFTHVGAVPLLFVGLALVIVLVLALGRLRPNRSSWPVGRVDLPKGRAPTVTARGGRRRHSGTAAWGAAPGADGRRREGGGRQGAQLASARPGPEGRRRVDEPAGRG